MNRTIQSLKVKVLLLRCVFKDQPPAVDSAIPMAHNTSRRSIWDQLQRSRIEQPIPRTPARFPKRESNGLMKSTVFKINLSQGSTLLWCDDRSAEQCVAVILAVPSKRKEKRVCVEVVIAFARPRRRCVFEQR